MAIVLAISAPPAGVALVDAAQNGDARTVRLIFEDTQRADEGAETADGGVRELQPGSRPDVEAPDGRAAIAPEPARALSGTVRSSPAAQAFTCDPLLEDRKGDVDNPAIDILASSITYDASANTLSIRHVIDDIPDTPPIPNEALSYEFDFRLDGTWYMAMAYIGPATYGNWFFSVQRDDRTRTDEWPNAPRQRVMDATGRVDTEDDTVSIEVDIERFNRGERRVADAEGLPPAAELRRGSRLTSVRLTSYPRSAGPGPYDVAHGCDYVIEERS